MNKCDFGAHRRPTGWIAEVLDYCPDTGVLTWKERPRSHFTRKRTWLATNKRFAGKAVAGTTPKGYLRLRIDGKDYQAHRVAWFLHHGKWPTDQLDHINGNRSDNRIANLRDVESGENQLNMSLAKNNTSGVIGVSFVANRWMAQIQFKGRHHYLGRFENISDAVAARKAAERQFGFHENHGRVK